MNQLEMNKRVADAYGVNEKRIELASLYSSQGWNTEDKIIPLHLDTLVLFRLCIEYNIDIDFNKESVATIFTLNQVVEEYENHISKEYATCFAMMGALTKLKGII